MNFGGPDALNSKSGDQLGMETLTPAKWTAYWTKGSITAFGLEFKHNYDGEFAEFWQLQLEGQVGHVVDLCCGNGALVWLADKILNDADVNAKVSGVDIADINPFKIFRKNAKDFPGIDFIGNTSADALPFSDHSVDVVISQYGVEYTDVRKTIEEVSRVLKAQSKMAFIVHSDSSVIVKGSRVLADKFRYILGDGGLYQTALKLHTLFNAKPAFADAAADPTYRQLVGQLKQALYHVHNMHNSHDAMGENYVVDANKSIKPYLNFVPSLFNGTRVLKSRKREKELSQWYEQGAGALAIYDDLSAAALSADELSHLIGCIQDNGFLIDCREDFHYGPEKKYYGTAIVASRSSLS